MSRMILCSVSIVAAATVPIGTATRYNLGHPATAGETKACDISVAPDGVGLPEGSGTALQGRAVYEAQCAICHGARGEGNADYPALVGGRGTLNTDKAFLTVGSYWPYATTVWDYIHRAMPYRNPGSLTPNEVYSVTAYVLFMNGIVGLRDQVTAKSLPTVKMPNRDGFVPDPRPDVK